MLTMGVSVCRTSSCNWHYIAKTVNQWHGNSTILIDHMAAWQCTDVQNDLVYTPWTCLRICMSDSSPKLQMQHSKCSEEPYLGCI